MGLYGSRLKWFYNEKKKKENCQSKSKKKRSFETHEIIQKAVIKKFKNSPESFIVICLFSLENTLPSRTFLLFTRAQFKKSLA